MSTHQEKQRIFDEYAKSVGFGCFDNILKHYQKYDAFLTKGLEEHIFSACNLLQEYLLNKAAVKPLITVKEKGFKEWKGTFYSSPYVQITVAKDSIINLENKIQ